MANEAVIISPQAGPQSDFLSCPADEIFYGGARGGGKSHGILLDFCKHAFEHGENVSGILFRRTYPE